MSLLAASMVLMPPGLVMIVLSPAAAGLSRIYGARLLLAAGAVVILLA